MRESVSMWWEKKKKTQEDISGSFSFTAACPLRGGDIGKEEKVVKRDMWWWHGGAGGCMGVLIYSNEQGRITRGGGKREKV